MLTGEKFEESKIQGIIQVFLESIFVGIYTLVIYLVLSK